jgi:hypothetical protein
MTKFKFTCYNHIETCEHYKKTKHGAICFNFLFYAKGHHPNITDTNCTVYDVITCEWHDFDDCSNERKIHVRQCGNDTQYYLARTSALAGYCMGKFRSAERSKPVCVCIFYVYVNVYILIYLIITIFYLLY